MVFEQHLPAAPLSEHLDALMCFSGFMPDHTIERVVPTGNIFIIFELDGFVRHTYDNKTLQPNASYTKVWVSGVHRNYLSISAHQNSSMFIIQFKPQGAYPFFKMPMDELAEKVVPAGVVFGDSILELRDKLVDAADNVEKFALAEKWLSKQYDESIKPSEELKALITKLQQEPASNLGNIIDSFPNTQKHLIDLFKKYVGLTPKYYQRILRFNEILQRIQHEEKIAWADIAYSCGFSDQSHFIKEFKHFSGFNPGEFIAQAHNKQPNFFPLDREG